MQTTSRARSTRRTGCRSRSRSPESATTWEQVPDKNKELMIHVVTELLEKGVIALVES